MSPQASLLFEQEQQSVSQFSRKGPSIQWLWADANQVYLDERRWTNNLVSMSVHILQYHCLDCLLSSAHSFVVDFSLCLSLLASEVLHLWVWGSKLINILPDTTRPINKKLFCFAVWQNHESFSQVSSSSGGRCLISPRLFSLFHQWQRDNCFGSRVWRFFISLEFLLLFSHASPLTPHVVPPVCGVYLALRFHFFRSLPVILLIQLIIALLSWILQPRWSTIGNYGQFFMHDLF